MSSGDSIYSQEIRFKTWKCIRSSSDMYEHRPGNASDRARMKTFSFRLGDLFVSSGRLGWKWFRLMMKRLGKSSSDEGDSTHECQLAFDLFIGELISVS